MVGRKFDSEAFYERLFKFGVKCRKLASSLPRNNYNRVYGKQLIRSSSSPGANYIEALEALSNKDFVHRLRVCRKEVRESIHWLRNIKEANKKTRTIKDECIILVDEAGELKKMLSSSILTLEKRGS